MKIWIHQDVESGEYFMYDNKLWSCSFGPFEISNELHEHLREVERAYDAAQNVLASLVYGWENPPQKAPVTPQMADEITQAMEELSHRDIHQTTDGTLVSGKRVDCD